MFSLLRIFHCRLGASSIGGHTHIHGYSAEYPLFLASKIRLVFSPVAYPFLTNSCSRLSSVRSLRLAQGACSSAQLGQGGDAFFCRGCRAAGMPTTHFLNIVLFNLEIILITKKSQIMRSHPETKFKRRIRYISVPIILAEVDRD
jgi:hypothetical protein